MSVLTHSSIIMRSLSISPKNTWKSIIHVAATMTNIPYFFFCHIFSMFLWSVNRTNTLYASMNKKMIRILWFNKKNVLCRLDAREPTRPRQPVAVNFEHRTREPIFILLRSSSFFSFLCSSSLFFLSFNCKTFPRIVSRLLCRSWQQRWYKNT